MENLNHFPYWAGTSSFSSGEIGSGLCCLFSWPLILELVLNLNGQYEHLYPCSFLWISLCLFRPLRPLSFLPHTSHSHISTVIFLWVGLRNLLCVSSWRFLSQFVPNLFGQVEHTFGLSAPIWLCIWIFKWLFLRNLLSQMLHLIAFPFKWTNALCNKSSPFLLTLCEQ